jgi:dTDP-4-dehydrorhamnose reductase
VSNVVIFGKGFMGEIMSAELRAHFTQVDLVPTDIADRAAVAAVLAQKKPALVVNTAGKTGRPNVDWCETNQAATARSNVAGPIVLAECCEEVGAYLLHLGSGCIFYGDSPAPGGWREDDFANPTSYYSKTKYAADLALSGRANVAILRLRMPISDRPHDRNLITKLAKYNKVVDVENSVTVVSDLVDVVRKMLASRPQGIFHATNPGTMRHRELLALYKEYVDPAHTCELISADELVRSGLAAKARSNCLLASPKLAELGITMRPIDEALRATMKAYASKR